MKHNPSFLIVPLLLCLSGGSKTDGADLNIGSGDKITISDARELLVPDRYGNKGTLEITIDGTLKIGTGVENTEPLKEGISGLDLGVVENTGLIETDTFLRFAEGSLIGGIVTSKNHIAFDGASTITGAITAKQLIINASEEKDADGNVKVFAIDLTGAGASLDIEELVVNSVTKIDTKEGETLELESLYIGGTGTSLLVSENVVVKGNYTGMSETTIGSKPDEEGNFLGTITLLGGDSKQGGENNVIAQNEIFASQLQLKNYTVIEDKLKIHGGLLVMEGGETEGTESRVLLNAALITAGKVTVEKNGILRFNSDDQNNMIYHGYYYYNGIFLDGFELQDDALMDVAESDQSLSIAIGGTSSIAARASVEAYSINLSGVTPDGLGSNKVQTVDNYGSVTAENLLNLNNINLQNKQTGIIQAGAIKMLGSSVLDLSNSGTSDGGLHFTGSSRVLDIGASASVIATGKTLDFTGVEVVNKNTSSDGAIIAEQLVFGNGGSLSGTGYYLTGAKFKEGATLKLDNTGHLVFGDQGLIFEKGAVIETTIGTNGLGVAVTEGKISMEEGVILEITDGSNYSGRTRTFQILQGSEDSEFADLTLAESLFFSLNQTLYDDEGGLWVEIVKVNDLVDYAKSSNQRTLSTMIDGLLNEGRVSDNQKLIFDALMRIASDNRYRQALNELSGSSRENAVLYSLASPWQRPFNSIGFNRLSLALPTNQPTNLSGTGKEEGSTLLGQKKSWLPSRPKWNQPRWSFSQDLWADVYYNYTHLANDGNTPGGHGNRGGFFAGTALPSPSKESLLGISVGYSAAEYKQGRDKTDLADFRIGLYGGVNLFSRNLQLRGYVGYGIQDYEHNRAVQVGQYEPLSTSGKTDGDSMSAAIYLIRPIDMSDRYLLKPMIGFDMERISQDGFTEKGIDAVILNYDDVTLDRVMWRLGLTGDYQFDRFELTGRFIYGLKVSGDNTVRSTHRFMSPGNDPFTIQSVNIGDYAFDLGLGGNWTLNRSRSALLFFDYNANLTKNSGIHTTSLGILWKR